jgi:hypothetical protein
LPDPCHWGGGVVGAQLFRVRVAVLWVAVAVAVVTALLVYLFLPGALEEILAGEMEGTALTDALSFQFAAFGLVPLVMAVVALLVGDRANRYVNLVAGLLVGLLGPVAFVGHGLECGFNGDSLMFGVAGALAFLIAGLSWAALRKPASQAAATPS